MKYIFIFLALLSVDASAQKTSSDEQHFRLVLKNFKTAVKSRNLNGASKLMQFPFYTAKSDNGNGRELPADPISYNEFKTYKSAIFNEEVLRILLKLREDNLSEIEGNEDNYYAALRKTTDKGSKLYEVYAEYRQQRRNTESYFAFIFGRVRGSYKVIAYYGKWPLR